MATTSNKRKKAVAATVAAAALLLGGTFAWTSISQQALNESAGIVNVGGRLHDDFDGKNKDVYVENFTDPLNGGQPIYARVRLDEYMEVGQEAGSDEDLDGDNTVEATPVLDGTDRHDVTTWQTHVPQTDCAECDLTGTCTIHEHWSWDMGGETTYMPTFNKDKDSLESDVNGTYHGTDRDQDTHDKVYYDDYVVYGTGGAEDVAFDEKEAVEGTVTSVVGTAYYDDDTDTAPNDHENLVGVRTEEETHVAKDTVSADVVLMEDWIADGSQPGNYWVYDTDGWAYWANPIMPGEATGLLLDGIEMTKNPGEKCYYGINVVAQFATVGDWEYFENQDGSLGLAEGSDALRVMTAATEAVKTVSVSNDSGTTTVDPGATVTFSASGTDGTFTWEVYNADLEPVNSTISNGVLQVAENETNRSLIVVARSDDYPGVVGLSSIAVNVPEEKEDPNLKITPSVLSSFFTQANIALYDGDSIAAQQPDITVEVLRNGEAASAEEYKLYQYQPTEGGPSILGFIVGNETAEQGTVTYTINASYLGKDGITYTNTAEIVAADLYSMLGITPSGEETYVSKTGDEGLLQDGQYSDTTRITNSSQGATWVRSEGFIFGLYDVWEEQSQTNCANIPVNIAVYDGNAALPIDDYYVTTLAGTGTDGKKSYPIILSIPVPEEDAADYEVHISFTDNGTVYGVVYNVKAQ